MNPSVPPTYEYRGAARRRLTGTDDDIRALLHEYSTVGLEDAALWFPTNDVNITLKQMERFMRDIAPEFAG
jgi:hypothetical protein